MRHSMKEQLGTGLEVLGPRDCLEGLMMGEEHRKNEPSHSKAFP